MNFVVYGAGGIGGTIGARLHLAGSTVRLIARGAHFEAVRNAGLSFVTPEETRVLHIPVFDGPSSVDWTADDVVLLCVKSQQTVTALDALRRAGVYDVPIVCAQNGVANEREALRRFARVYGMVVILPAVHLRPGVVVTHASGVGGVLDVGCYPRGVDGIATAVADRLTRAGFSARPDPGVMRQKYAKLLMNLNNALQAATETTEATRPIADALRTEALACYRAAGIDCATADEVRARRADGPRLASVAGVPRSGGSSWQSLARGTGDVESDYLNGEIVLLGREYGVPTPANAALQRISQEMAHARAAPGSVPVADILARIERALAVPGALR